ncbi:SLC13 family permease [Modicisalibacter luteus]|uniref:SLC13 family permease n=1 Tax=Modicisalibacter luteus TaxID=453962 RepID=UPI0036298172
MTEQYRPNSEYEDSPGGQGSNGRSARVTWGLRAFGVAVALLVWIAMGYAEGLSSDARWVATIATLMAIWWMTEAIPLSATALLPIVLIPMLTERTVGQATAPYASSIVFLFLGGFLIAIAMEKWNLHRRIALLTLARVGVEPKRIVLGMMLATGFLSMWVSNTATTLMMLPIGLSVLRLVAERSGESLATTSLDMTITGPVTSTSFSTITLNALASACCCLSHGRRVWAASAPYSVAHRMPLSLATPPTS